MVHDSNRHVPTDHRSAGSAPARGRSRLLSVAAALTLAVAVVGVPSQVASAEPAAAQAPLLDTGVSLGSGLKVAVTVDVDQQKVHDDAQAALKNLRVRMYNDGSLPFEGSLGHSATLKDYAAKAGYDSADAYAGAFTWSQSLEMISIQRAAENAVTGMSHSRPTGVSTFDASYKGAMSSNGEIITEDQDITNAIDGTGSGSWAEEYASLKTNDGKYSGPSEAGHLHTLLDPQYTCYGFASAAVSMGEAGLAQSCAGSETGPSALSGSYRVPVTIPADQAAGVTFGLDSLDVGQSSPLEASVSYGKSGQLPVLVDSASSSDEGVVQVASDGTLTAVSPGEATITLVSNGVTMSHTVSVHGSAPASPSPAESSAEASSPAPESPSTSAPASSAESPSASPSEESPSNGSGQSGSAAQAAVKGAAAVSAAGFVTSVILFIRRLLGR